MAEYGINGTTLNMQHLAFRAQASTAWASDYVLLAGELGVETDTNKMKLGDGSTAWGELEYYSDPVVSGLIETLTGRVGANEGNITTQGERITTAEGNISDLQAADTTHESRMTAIEGVNTTQAGEITALDGRLDTVEAKDTEQDGRLSALEGITIISANPFRE